MANHALFKPGNPGGPGRPKGQTFRDILRAKLKEPHPRHPGKRYIDVWFEEMARDANVAQQMEILKWLDGASPPDKGRNDEDLMEPMAADANGRSLDP